MRSGVRGTEGGVDCERGFTGGQPHRGLSEKMKHVPIWEVLDVQPDVSEPLDPSCSRSALLLIFCLRFHLFAISFPDISHLRRSFGTSFDFRISSASGGFNLRPSLGDKVPEIRWIFYLPFNGHAIRRGVRYVDSESVFDGIAGQEIKPAEYRFLKPGLMVSRRVDYLLVLAGFILEQ